MNKLYKCEKCGNYMIVTSINTAYIDLYCPNCKRRDEYPKQNITTMQTNNVIIGGTKWQQYMISLKTI